MRPAQAVRVLPPDPAWQIAFASERELILGSIDIATAKLHHIGSTAIRGIWAKPVIDMLLVVPDLALLDNQTAVWEHLGHQAMGEFGIEGRRYFRKDDASGTRTHQVHAFAQGSAHIARHLAFVAYMNAHAEIAQQYSELKKALAERHPADMDAYMDGKDAFIKRHEALALACTEFVAIGQQLGAELVLRPSGSLAS